MGRKLVKMHKTLLPRCWTWDASEVCKQRFTEGDENDPGLKTLTWATTRGVVDVMTQGKRRTKSY